jgi:hypothetical protein
MNNSFRFLLFASFVFNLIACAPTPRSSFRFYQEQPTVLAAKHWQDLADTTAKEYIATKESSLDGKLSKSVSYKPTSVYIQMSANDSAFDRSFHNYLSSAFLKRGIPVQKQSNNATVINYSTETFLYSNNNSNRSLFTYASFIVIYQKLMNITGLIDDFDVSILGLGLVLDYLEKDQNLTNAEVVLTISVEDANTIKYKSSTEFYINRNDIALYWSDKPPGAMRLEGGQSDTPLKTVSLPVTK